MSWSIKVIGTRKAVKAAVNNHTSLPQSVKDVVTAVCDAGDGKSGQNGIMVESNGHIGGDYSSCNLNITNCIIAPEPVEAAPVAEAAPAATTTETAAAPAGEPAATTA